MTGNKLHQECIRKVALLCQKLDLRLIRSCPSSWGIDFAIGETIENPRFFLLELDYRDQLVTLWLAGQGEEPAGIAAKYTPTHRNPFPCLDDWARKNQHLDYENRGSIARTLTPEANKKKFFEQLDYCLQGLEWCLKR